MYARVLVILVVLSAVLPPSMHELIPAVLQGCYRYKGECWNDCRKRCHMAFCFRRRSSSCITCNCYS